MRTPGFWRRRVCLALLAVGLAGGIGVWAARLEGAARPTPSSAAGPQDRSLRDFDLDCMRSGCHGGMKERAWVHGPVAVGSCDACHRPKGPEAGEHAFELTRSKEQVCTYCHRNPELSAPFVHSVIPEVGCIGCHDPHGGATRTLLPERVDPDLCLRCHQPERQAPDPAADKPRPGRPFSERHKPVADGKCLTCHEAHESAHEGLLVLPERELCLGCHEDFANRLVQDGLQHAPVQERCGNCHAPHGSNVRHLLDRPTVPLCLDCHSDVKECLATGTWVAPALASGAAPESGKLHGALKEPESCLQCHSPHASRETALLREPVQEGCYACHDREIAVEGKRSVADVKGQVLGAKFVHEPVAKGDCLACHRGHGSEHPGLLGKEHGLAMYVEYHDSAYDLCFDCHDRRLVTEEQTLFTNFRDGARNLHYVHVRDEAPAAPAAATAGDAPGTAPVRESLAREKPRRKGRSCGTCHVSHAGDNPRLLRDSVPFGPIDWPLELNFAPLADGGQCASGCHKEKRYTNDSPPPPPPEEWRRSSEPTPGSRR